MLVMVCTYFSVLRQLQDKLINNLIFLFFSLRMQKQAQITRSATQPMVSIIKQDFRSIPEPSSMAGILISKNAFSFEPLSMMYFLARKRYCLSLYDGWCTDQQKSVIVKTFTKVGVLTSKETLSFKLLRWSVYLLASKRCRLSLYDGRCTYWQESVVA